MDGGGPAANRAEPVIERTILFTDIEGSTTRWDQDAETMSRLLERHDEVCAATVAQHAGVLLKHTGDGIIAHFATPNDGVACAIDLQMRFLAFGEDGFDLRMGLHRGEVEQRDGDLFGPAMNRAARIMSAGCGRQIIVSSAVADELDLADATLLNLGVHRLRGLAQPESVAQVLHAGLPADFPPIASMNATIGNLGAHDQHDLVGRADATRQVSTSIDEHRLVSLVGPGGIGKTRLARQVAQEFVPRAPDGVWFVDLSLASTDDRVLPTIAEVLDVARPPGISLDQAVRRAVSSSRMIVLLDNCEHVLDGARSAVATLTDGSAHVHVLCTTQRRLGLAIEEVVPVEPLGSSAPELFRLRATAADPAFEFDAATRTTVERICESVDGLPLAIELAASRCRTMSVEEIADRLGEPLRLLRSRDGAARHRTLENAIAWSVGLLDPADRELLISLAVFPSSFTWNAAGSVAQLDEFDVVDRLSELLDRSLVTRIDVTYRLLDSVRAFCNAQLDERGDRPIVLERHAAWLRQAVPVPIDGLDTDAVANRLTAAADLIEDAWVALGTLIDRAPEQAALLVLDFTDLWVAYSRADEAIAWLERCLPLDVTHTTRMSVLGWLSGFSWLAGNNDDVERYARTALTEATQAGRPLPGYAATRLALREAFTADPQVSIEHARLAEQAARREPDNASRLLSVIAVIHAIHGDLDTAIRLGDEAIAMSRNEGVLRLGTCLMNRLLVSQGDPSGLPIADEMIGLTERLGRIGGRGQAIFARVLSQRAVGDDAGLLVSLSRALQAFADDHQPVHIASVIDLLPAPLMRVSPRSSALFFGAGRRNETDLGQRSPLVSDDDLERIEAELRHRLGDAEFEQTCAMGAAMSNEEAVDAVRWLTGSSHQSIEAAG